MAFLFAFNLSFIKKPQEESSGRTLQNATNACLVGSQLSSDYGFSNDKQQLASENSMSFLLSPTSG